MLGFAADEPDVHAAATWYLEPVDYLTARCVGRAGASAASMAGAWLTDVRQPEPQCDRRLIDLAGVDASRLPPLWPSGSLVGTITADLARHLGLAPSVAVVAGTPDLHTAWVGSGTHDHGGAHVSISTTSWISCAVATKGTDARHSIATVPGVQAGSFLVADNHEAAGASLAWLARDLLGDDFAAACAQAATAPPGSNGVVFAPWLAGMRSPVDDRQVRGTWVGLGLATSRADLYRSVLEGVALHSQWLLGQVERFAGRRFDTLRILGGGAQSDLWCQIHADALGRSVERVVDPMLAQSRGAALLAGVALGRLTWDQIPHRVPIDVTFVPDPENHRHYQRLGAQLPRIHAGLRRVFPRLVDHAGR